MGYHAGSHVATLIGCDTHEEIGMFHTSILHGVDAGGASLQRHDVILAVQIAQTSRVFVDEHAVLVVARPTAPAPAMIIFICFLSLS